jgi:hypothetical protein
MLKLNYLMFLFGVPTGTKKNLAEKTHSGYAFAQIAFSRKGIST